MSDAPVEVEVRGAVALVTLNRPKEMATLTPREAEAVAASQAALLDRWAAAGGEVQGRIRTFLERRKRP